MQLCGSLSILWHCLSLGLQWKLTISSPVATAEFSKFAGILSTLSQYHLLGFEIAQLEFRDFPGGSEVKASAWNAGDSGLVPGLGRSPGEGNGNPLQRSCLENPRDGGASWAAVYVVAQSRTRLKQLSKQASKHMLAKYAQNSPNEASIVCEVRTSRCSSWI